MIKTNNSDKETDECCQFQSMSNLSKAQDSITLTSEA